MKKKIWITLLALLIVGGVCGATLAFFTDAKDLKNVFVMGDIGITLSEPAFEEATEGTYHMENAKFNQTITKDPQITVADWSMDVYLRANITYKGLNEQEIDQIEDNIKFEDGWYKGEDGKYYYNKKAAKNDVVQIFSEITIPDEWDDGIHKKEFEVNVNAEAIQADYFTPDTKEETGGRIIITSWKNKNGTIVSVEQ